MRGKGEGKRKEEGSKKDAMTERKEEKRNE